MDFDRHEPFVLDTLGEVVVWHAPGGDVALKAMVADARQQSDHGAYDTVETGLHVSLSDAHAIRPGHEMTVRGSRRQVVETEPDGAGLKKVYLA